MVSVYGSPLYQWDRNRQLKIEPGDIGDNFEIHCCHRDDTTSLVVLPIIEGDSVLVNVPNILLQRSGFIRVYVVSEGDTIYDKSFYVMARQKPDDYVYTETEVLSYLGLEKRVAKLEDTLVDTDEIIEDLIEQTAPVSYKAQTLTEAQKAQARKNIGAVEDNKLELIESITLAEPSGVYRTQTPNGRVYKLNRLKVYVRTPADNNDGGYVNLVVYSNKGNYIIFFCNFEKSVSREMVFEGWKEANMWDAEETSSTASYAYSQLAKLTDGKGYLREPNAYGDYISIMNINQTLPAGTVVNIYGRWEKDA